MICPNGHRKLMRTEGRPQSALQIPWVVLEGKEHGVLTLKPVTQALMSPHGLATQYNGICWRSGESNSYTTAPQAGYEGTFAATDCPADRHPTFPPFCTSTANFHVQYLC